MEDERNLFIDTWGWIVIHNQREERHREVKSFYRNFRLRGGMIYTTDYVLDETLTLLFRRLPSDLAAEAIHLLDLAIHQGYLNLVWISPKQFEAAKQLRLQFRDKPLISFTDLTSIAVMKELGINWILTEDNHFIKIGLNLQKKP